MDQDLDQRLFQLGIDPANPEVLLLLPLIEVAWADGEVQPGERDVILRVQQDHHPLPADAALLLETWLTHRPTPSYLSRGRQALSDLIRGGRIPWKESDGGVVESTMSRAMDVARSAGGWFGFRAVDPDEQHALAAIADAMADLQDTRIDRAEASSEDDQDHDPHYRPTPVRVPEGLPEVTTPSIVKLGERYAVPIGDRFTIGRKRSNTLPLPGDPRVSREHALLAPEDGNLILRDLGTASGTFVDGERIVGRRIFGGEVIQISDTSLTVIGV